MKDTIKAGLRLSANNSLFDDDDPDGLVCIATLREHIQLYKDEDPDTIESFFVSKSIRNGWSRRMLTNST